MKPQPKQPDLPDAPGITADPEHLDNLEGMHLEWMFDNQPELVRLMLKKGTLRQHLEDKEQQALFVADQLEAGGVPKAEVLEAAIDQIIAPAVGPAFSDNPPEPMPDEERREVLLSLGEDED